MRRLFKKNMDEEPADAVMTKLEVIRHALFGGAILFTAVLVWWPLWALFDSDLKRDYHTLIPFIPVITLYLLYLKRRNLRTKVAYYPVMGMVVIAAGLALYTLAWAGLRSLNVNDQATFRILSALVFLWGAFLLIYGPGAFKAVLFPLLFLLFMVPLPFQFMEQVITFLQRGSTEFANLLFFLSQVPYYRDGFSFHLTGISVCVAPECSGIRSGLALFITAWLAGYLFLYSPWRRIMLVLMVFPITMFKNGIRISTLTLLGTYVDPRILESSLHREGGIPFFGLALLMLAAVLYFLRKGDCSR